MCSLQRRARAPCITPSARRRSPRCRPRRSPAGRRRRARGLAHRVRLAVCWISRQPREVGKTLSGLNRSRGLNEFFSPAIAHRSSVVKTSVSCFFFSSADAVLAGDRAAERRRSRAGSRRRLQHPLDLAGVAAVEQDQRVQVAVAGVEDVGDQQLVLPADLLDARQRAPAAWCAARRRPAGSSSAPAGPSRRGPSCAPSRARRSRRRCWRQPHAGCAPFSRQMPLDLLAASRPARRSGRRPRSAARAGVGRVADVVGRLDRLAGQRVHHLQRARHDARGDDRRDGLARRRRRRRRRPAGRAPPPAAASRRTIALVTMPSVPSEPTMTPVRS